MELKAYAKINLSLDVLDKRPDGYHDLNSVMVQIDLFDTLSFEESEDVILEGGVKGDIILKTVNKIKNLFKVDKGVKISLKKNIPMGYGFGGGSADAAATLKALNDLWGLNIGIEELIKIGIEIGSDVPFCLVGGACFVSGKGDIVEKIEIPEMDFVCVNPGYSISTKDAYQELDGFDYDRISTSLNMKEGGDVKAIADGIHNDFIRIQKDDVKELVIEIVGLGALNASITGKGPTVFGIFKDRGNAMVAYEKLKDSNNFVHIGKTIK